MTSAADEKGSFKSLDTFTGADASEYPLPTNIPEKKSGAKLRAPERRGGGIVRGCGNR